MTLRPGGEAAGTESGGVAGQTEAMTTLPLEVRTTFVQFILQGFSFF